MAITIQQIVFAGSENDYSHYVDEYLKKGSTDNLTFTAVDEANEFVKDLYEAILNVRSSFYTSSCEKNIEGYVEHIIAYELYHQWSNIIDSKFNNYLLDNHTILQINGEIGKRILNDNEQQNDSQSKYPDMVLHGGQDDKRHQEIIVEIKRWNRIKSDSKQTIDDIEKLFKYTSKGNFVENSAFPYKKGMFIVTCKCDELSDTDPIINKLKKQITQLSNWKDISRSRKDKITCVICVEGKYLVFFKLSNLSQFYTIWKTPNTNSVEYKIIRNIIEQLSIDYVELTNIFKKIVRDLRFQQQKDTLAININGYKQLAKLEQSKKLKDKNAFKAMRRYCEYYGVDFEFIKHIEKSKDKQLII